MREIQTPQKQQNLQLSNRKPKEPLSQLKNSKVSKKSLNGAFSSLVDSISPEHSSDPSQISNISDPCETSLTPPICSTASNLPFSTPPLSDDLDLSPVSRTVNLINCARSHATKSVDADKRRQAVDEIVKTVMNEYGFCAALHESDHFFKVKKRVITMCVLICCLTMFFLFYYSRSSMDSPYRGRSPT